MRACPACGASNDPTDDFCGNCGAYLGWSDSSATPGSSASGTATSGTASEPPATSTSAEAPAAGTSSAPSTPGAPRPTAPEPPAASAPAESSTPDTPAEPPATTAAASPTPAEEAAAAAPGRSSSLRTRLTGRVRGEREAGAAPAAGSPSADGGSQGPGTASGQDGTTSPAAPRTDPDDAGAEPSAPARHPGEAASAARLTHPAPATPPAPAPRNVPGPRPPVAPTPTPAPVTPTTPQPPTPAPIQPVRPAKPVAPRPVVRPIEAPDEVAGAPCPSCGTPNPPDRRFCRRCATALNPSAKPEPLPWWRTVWPFRRRVRASSGRAVRLLVILAVVVALCAAALLLLPAGRALFEDTRDKLGKAKPITPVDTKASAQSPRHPAKNTTDGITNSYWGAPAPGASVTYTFRKPFRMVDLIITNGPSKDPEEYHGQARALQIDLEVTTQNGEQQHKQLTLSDKPGPQTFTTGISDVTTVRLVLRSPVGLTSGRQLALAEVEFFQRS